MTIEERVNDFLARKEVEILEHCPTVDGPEAEPAWQQLRDAIMKTDYDDELKHAVIEEMKARGYLQE